MENFSTGSRRDSRDGKGRYDLIPWIVISQLSKRFESGAQLYGDRNWEKGQPLGRYLDSALRHLFQFLEGEINEDHGIASIWNLIALMATLQKIKDGELPESLDDLEILRKQKSKISKEVTANDSPR
jgi:hypothetical protein